MLAWEGGKYWTEKNHIVAKFSTVLNIGKWRRVMAFFKFCTSMQLQLNCQGCYAKALCVRLDFFCSWNQIDSHNPGVQLQTNFHEFCNRSAQRSWVNHAANRLVLPFTLTAHFPCLHYTYWNIGRANVSGTSCWGENTPAGILGPITWICFLRVTFPQRCDTVSMPR